MLIAFLILFKDCIFNNAHEANVKHCVRQGLTTEEFFERADSQEIWSAISAEIRETFGGPSAQTFTPLGDTIQKTHTVAMGFMAWDTTEEIAKQLDTQADDIKEVLKPKLELAKKIGGLDPNKLDTLRTFERKAAQKVADSICLLVEPKSSSLLAKVRGYKQF